MKKRRNPVPPASNPRVRPMTPAERERRDCLVALAGTGTQGLSAHDLAQALEIPVKVVWRRLCELEKRRLVARQPEGRQVKVEGRWCDLWVRADALLDGPGSVPLDKVRGSVPCSA